MSTLLIDRRGVSLKLDGGAIILYESGERVGTIPITPLERVIIRGDVTLESSLLGKLGVQGVGVIFLSGRKNEPSLFMARQHNDAARRIAQMKKSLDETFCIAISQDILNTKLNNQKLVLQRFAEQRIEHRYEINLRINTLKTNLSALKTINSLSSLRGLEGSAAAAYFSGLSLVVPPSLNFKGRNRRPPKDPLNAVLSLSYTLLHSECQLSLHSLGLDPYIGFFHSLNFGRASLASDLMEPLRPIVDEFSLSLFKKGILRPENFSQTESGCLMGKAGRERYYMEWHTFSERLRKQVNETARQLLIRLNIEDISDDSSESDPQQEETWNG